MNLCRYLPAWLRRFFHCRHVTMRVQFRRVRKMRMVINNDPSTETIMEFAHMTDTVTLQVIASAVQTCTALASITVNGSAFAADVTWSTADDTVAVVVATPDVAQQARVTAVRDTVPSTRTTQITASATVNGQPVTAHGTVTVETAADQVSMTIDFGSPEFVTP